MKANPNIPGWAGNIYPWQEEVAVKFLPHGGTYLEIGTFLGASLAHLGTLRPDINLIAVDPWIDEPGGELSVGPLAGGGFKHRGWDGLGIYEAHVKRHGTMWEAFHAIMKEHAPDVLRRTKVVRGTAATAGLKDRVHVLFVDGAHDKPNVATDLDVFAPLVLPGGIIAGHDYDGFWPGVVEAVDERYKGRVKTRETCWWVEA